MKIFKYLFLIALAILAVGSAKAETAQQVLDRATKSLKGSVSADFTITGANSMSGSFKASGKKFALSSPQLSIWYNGTHMWTYNASTKETTKVKPSASEVAESNPMVFVGQNANAFKAEYGKAANASETVLILTPKTKGNGIERAVLTLDKKSLKPKKVALKINGNSVVVTFSRFTQGGSYANSTFEYPASKYPKVKVINL